MRVHIQNLDGMVADAVTLQDWQAAAARAGLADRQHTVSVGETLDDFARAIPETEALVTATRATSASQNGGNWPVGVVKQTSCFCPSPQL